MKKILGTSFIGKLLTILVLSLLLTSGAKAGCDDAPTDGVDYSNCQFSEGQDLSRAYIPNSNLSFISFIKVTFDKEGVYVYQCTPHSMMAMIGVIKVGSPSNLEIIKGKAEDQKKVFVMNKERLTNYLLEI